MVEKGLQKESDARTLVGQVRESSLAVMKRINSDDFGEKALGLLSFFVPRGQDDGPDIPITAELMVDPQLRPAERLALFFGKKLFGDFNSNFGRGSNSEELFNWKNSLLKGFFVNAASAINGLMSLDNKEEGSNSREAFRNIVRDQEGATGCLYDLYQWAEAKFRKSQ